MKKNILLFSYLFFLFILTSCGDDYIEITKKYYSTGSISSGTILTSNSYIGYIQGDEMVNLATKMGGRVVGVYIKEGDKVKAGDLLVKLDSLEAKVGYSTANSIVDSLLSMKSSTASMFDEQIKSMESKVEQVRLGGVGIQNGVSDTIKITQANLQTSKTAIETAKANLEHTKSILDTKKKHIYDNSKDAIVGAVILDTNIINFIDSLLGVTDENRDKNDKFEDYLSAKNSQYLNEAKIKFKEINLTYLDYKEFYNSEIEGKNPENQIVIKGLDDGEKLAEDLKILLDLTYDILDNSIENYYFNQSTIDNYKANISSFGINIESSLVTVAGDYILGLKGSKQGLEDFDNSSLMQVDLLEKQLLLAENAYTSNLFTSEAEVRNINTKSDVSDNQLDEIISGLESLKDQKNTKLSEIDSKIAEARGQKNTAGVMIDAGEIRSPIDGIITSKSVEIGQVVGGGIPLITVSEEDNLELNISILESLSSELFIGKEVILEIEGVNKQETGIIKNINLSKDIISKKIGVEISVSNNSNNIKIGSLTNIIFNNNSGNNGIIIPNSSIVSRFMIPGVYTLDNGKIKFKNIEILKQNDTFSEISGAEIGETIIINGKENIYDGEILN